MLLIGTLGMNKGGIWCGAATESEWGHGQADRGAGRKTEAEQDP